MLGNRDGRCAAFSVFQHDVFAVLREPELAAFYGRQFPGAVVFPDFLHQVGLAPASSGQHGR